MQSDELHPDAIPWSMREVWYGVGFLALWLVLMIAVAIWIGLSAAKIDIGMFIPCHFYRT
jgi:hypothetical protein